MITVYVETFLGSLFIPAKLVIANKNSDEWCQWSRAEQFIYLATRRIELERGSSSCINLLAPQSTAEMACMSCSDIQAATQGSDVDPIVSFDQFISSF